MSSTNTGSNKKTLYLIDKINNVKINSSCHVSELIPFIEAQSNIQTVIYDLNINDMSDALEEINEKADILFIIHDFKHWNNNSIDIDYGHFTYFLSRLWNNKNIFVFPTQMASAALIKSHFKENSPLINKIIVGSDAFRKLFIKIDSGLGLASNKLKLINIPTNESTYIDSNIIKQKQNVKKKMIFTPGLLHPKKDYKQLINDMKPLLKLYKNLVYVIALKKHPSVSSLETDNLVNEIEQHIADNELNDRVQFSIDMLSGEKYQSYLRISDLIIFPFDNSLDMYNGSLIDALGMGKAIITPASPFTEDLVKKTSILLYSYTNTQSFIDACVVVLDNQDLSDILQHHNYEYGNMLAYPKIAQQYINQIKRFKFN